jgi:tetratricopeptide (TPR) repeat protein
MSVSAQIQKTRNNRVYVDEDDEYTQAARRTRTIDEQTRKGLVFYKDGDYDSAAKAFSIAAALAPTRFAAQHNLGVTHLHLGDFKRRD